MKAFLNLKIFAKLGIFYNLLMIVILVIAVGSYVFFSLLNQDTQRIIDDNLIPMKSLAELTENFQFIRGDLYKYLLFDNQERSAVKDNIAKNSGAIDSLLASFPQALLTPDEKIQFERFQSGWGQYQQAIQNIYRNVEANNMQAAQQSLWDGEAHLARAEAQAAMNQLRNLNLQAGEQLHNHSHWIQEQATLIMIFLTVTGILIGIGSNFVINGTVVRPLDKLAEVAAGIAEGRLDLTSQINIEHKDEIGAAAAAFNRMTVRVQQMIQKDHEQSAYQQKTIEQYVAHMARFAAGDHTARLNIKANGHSEGDALVVLGRNLDHMTGQLAVMISQMRDAATDLDRTSNEIRAVTTQQSSSAAEQSAAIAQTSITIEEVKTIAEQSAQRSRDMTTAANRTLMVSQAGQQALQDMIDSMYQIKQRVQGIAENILALSEQSQLISDITATVNQIATQSNLLALNASVEAARAGEAGKGFAVVASEVRHLAEESRMATSQVKDILTEIQKATNVTVMATEEGIKRVERGVQLALQSQEAITHLTNVIADNASASTQVAAGSQQQAAGIDQVAVAIHNINQATQQNLSATRQAEDAAQTLYQLAQKFNEILN